MRNDKKSNDKNIVLSPMSEFETHLLVTLLLFPLFLDFVSIIEIIVEKNLIIMLVLLIYRFLLVTVYIFLKLFIYNTKFSVNTECLTKTKGRKVIFKVDVKDIDAVFINPSSRFSILKFWLKFIVNFIFVTPEDIFREKFLVTYISIVYKESSVCFEEKQEIPRVSLKPETMTDCFEHNEILSYKKCMKMCEVLGIEPQIVHLNKHKTAK